VPSFKIAEWA